MGHREIGHSRAWAEVDAAALAHNITLLQAYLAPDPSPRLMAVVKADAYGHGVALIAPLCYHYGIRDFGIATVDEGIALRALLPAKAAIYLIASSLPEDAPDIVANDLIPLVSTVELGRALSDAARAHDRTAQAHLDVDTGIGRAGVLPEDIPKLLRALDALPSLHVTGLATHFASADEDPVDAQAQYGVFTHLLASLGDRARSLLVHADNSPATLMLPPESRQNLVRAGLLLYGIEPAPGMFVETGLLLLPVLSVKARVLLCRNLPGGATISYGRTYTVPEGGGVYATLGIGYGDGWPRRLSNTGYALLHGRRAPIRGRICMDQLVVDVSHIPKVRGGDIATLIGTDGLETITAAGLATELATTPHEITTCLTSRLPRLLADG